MKYIIPGFIVFDKSSNKIKLKNTVTGLEVQLNNEYISELKRILSNGTESIQSELQSFLHQNDILFNKDEFKLFSDEFYKKNNEILNIILYTSQNCNFRCVYCYEEFEDNQLTSLDYDFIYNFIENKLLNEKISNLNISWFGGEPLLNIDEILNFTKKCSKLTQKYKNINIRSNMTTNGYLLNIENFNNLLNAGVKSFQITLDGTNHDKYRKLINGENTYNTIINNIIAITEQTKHDNYLIMIRRNIGKLDNTFQWYENLSNIIKNKSQIVFNIRPISQLSSKNIDIPIFTKDEKEALIINHIDYLIKLGFNTVEKDEKFCYANYKNSFAFTPNGLIQKCTVAQKDSKNTVGTYNSTKNIFDFNESKNENWYRIIKFESCFHCAKFAYCPHHSCPLHAIGTNFCNEFTKEESRNIL